MHSRPKVRFSVEARSLESFCARWKITELSFFGSVLREDFGPDSDVDVLVSFHPTAEWSLFDHVEMEAEPAALVGRRVDLVTRAAVERSGNWIRRSEILETAVRQYGAT